MIVRVSALVCVICLVVGCDGGSKPTDSMKAGQEKKLTEPMKKKAPED